MELVWWFFKARFSGHKVRLPFNEYFKLNWPHRYWSRLLETKCDIDNYKMLVSLGVGQLGDGFGQ